MFFAMDCFVMSKDVWRSPVQGMIAAFDLRQAVKADC